MLYEVLKDIIKIKWRTKNDSICLEMTDVLSNWVVKWLCYPLLEIKTNDEALILERLKRRDGMEGTVPLDNREHGGYMENVEHIRSDSAVALVDHCYRQNSVDYVIANNGTTEELLMHIQENIPNYIFDIC